MNLYLRMLWALLRCWRLPALQPADTLERTFRVLPNDLDINGHMNNGRYLTVIDLMLIEFFVRTGFARVMLREGWRPMSGGAIISYRKGLQPLQRYRVRFALAGSDAAWNYMRFHFLRGQCGQLRAPRRGPRAATAARRGQPLARGRASRDGRRGGLIGQRRRNAAATAAAARTPCV